MYKRKGNNRIHILRIDKDGQIEERVQIPDDSEMESIDEVDYITWLHVATASGISTKWGERGEALVVKEGEFIWNSEKGDYVEKV